MPRKNEKSIQIDKYIGDKIHQTRIAMGLSRQQLAEAIDVTHQQLHKYEKATNRISASKLIMIADVLKMPIESFFEKDEGYSTTNQQRLTLQAVRNMNSLGSKERYAVCQLIRILSEKHHEPKRHAS